jgi:uncharacterized cupredoxin-like copper-binding protein
MKNKLSILSVLGLLALLLAATAPSALADSPQPVEVTVTLQDYTVTMDKTSLPANTPIRFTFKNMGGAVHEAVLEKAGANDQPLELAGSEAEVEDIATGETRSAVWTIPEAGDYQLACHVENHFQNGMKITFTVTPSTSGLGSLALVGIAAGAVAVVLFVLGAVLVRRKHSAV